MPIGAAINKDKNVIIKVVTTAGNKDTFCVLYSKANNEGFIYGTPLIKIYPMIINSIEKVENPEKNTSPLINLLNLFNYVTFLFNTENNPLISKIKTNNTTPVPINASLCKSAAYPISITILAVRVRIPFNIPLGIRA